MKPESLDVLLQEVSRSRDARTAAMENGLRRQLGEVFSRALEQKGLQRWAKAIGISTSQARRLLHLELGGRLTLRSICRAADALGIQLELRVTPGQTRPRVQAVATKPTLEDAMKVSYAIELHREEEGFVAVHPDLPGCVADGDSATEAVANLGSARRLWIECRLEDGLPVPKPRLQEPDAALLQEVQPR